MEEALPQPINYGDIFRRRLSLGLFVGLALLVLTAGIALGLPAIFKSRAVILIEQQEIPQDLVRSLVTSYADQRLQVIAQRVMTNNNVSEIIEKYDLYAEKRKSEPLESVIAEMREDITIAPISADVVDQKSGKATKATIAFELAFDSPSPSLAQRVANDLVSLFLNENLKQRTETTEQTLSFLTAESDKLEKTVAELENKLAEFKERNAGRLPELTSLNLQLMNTREQDLVQIQNQIRSLEQQRVYLESELAQQQPNTELYAEDGKRIMAPTDRLKILESEYIPLSARYGTSHPDVVAMRKEIDSLRVQAGTPTPTTELEARLVQLQTELSGAAERYSADHPDVRRLNREIASLKSEIDRSRMRASAAVPAPSAPRPDNPVYIQLQARLDATAADLRSLQGQRAELQAKISEFERRLTAAPQVEREYKSLTRDYETALSKYREVLAKRQEAELARSLESGQKGERFTLIEPPVIPEQPDRPNRMLIGLLGFALTIAGSIGVGAMAEAADDRIYGRSGVSRLIGVPPLAVIPQLDNAAARAGRLRRRALLIGAFIAFLAVLALAVHFFYSPLDVLFYRAIRVLGS